MTSEVLSKPKFDVYRSITENIIAAIEKGAGEFRMPWHCGAAGRPVNAFTGKLYQGVNAIALWADGLLRGFDSAHWATYRQWGKPGAQVRKGEQGAVVLFYKSAEPTSSEEQVETEETRPRIVARASWVFNASQVEGWAAPQSPQIDRVESLDRAEIFIKKTGADIRERGHRAFYSPGGDFIQLPPRSSFVGTETSVPTEAYYATLFHELTHWTGHPSRLKRELSGRFGEQAYAAEELVAELGAAFLCADLGVSNVPRADHAQYVGSWHSLLRFDKRAIFTAASQAGAAAKFLAKQTGNSLEK